MYLWTKKFPLNVVSHLDPESVRIRTGITFPRLRICETGTWRVIIVLLNYYFDYYWWSFMHLFLC